jgi:hypothetical protein
MRACERASETGLLSAKCGGPVTVKYINARSESRTHFCQLPPLSSRVCHGRLHLPTGLTFDPTMTISHITTLAELDKHLGKQGKLTVGVFIFIIIIIGNADARNADRSLTFMQRTLAFSLRRNNADIIILVDGVGPAR